MRNIGEYIRDKTDRLLDEWGYGFETSLHKCHAEDTLFVKHVRYVHSDDFILSEKDLSFYKHIYEKGSVKTLLLFYYEDEVYYGFLQDVELERNEYGKKLTYVVKDSLKRIDFNDRKPYG